jgi:hypothetical protein
MKINEGLRIIGKRRKIRKALNEIYSQKSKVNGNIPLVVEEGKSLCISKEGFVYDDNSDLDNLGGTLKHLPWTNRHYLITSFPCKYVDFNLPHATELLDLFKDLDLERVKKHFYFGLEKRL